MYSEINAAVNFLNHFLFDKLPRRKVNLFSQQLANFLLMRYEKTWSPSEPHKGSETRRIQIKVHGGITDSLISVTASNVGLDLDEVLQQWPDELTIWVDPGEVTYRVGERGRAMMIYSASEANNALLNRLLSQGAGLSADGHALRLNLPSQQTDPLPLPIQETAQQPLQPQQQAPSSVVATNGSGANPGAGNNPTFELSSPNDVQFTVGSFAMTRFGTTKVKNSPAALNRLRQKHRTRPNEIQFRPIFNQSASSSSPSFPSRILPSPTFCAAPGSSRPSTANASLNPSTNSSPHSSGGGRDVDSDSTLSPANDITSPLFGLPPLRPSVWSNF